MSRKYRQTGYQDDDRSREGQHNGSQSPRYQSLTPEERIRVTNWVDTNAQYYGMYWGRKNLRYRDHPNFRPRPTFERATSMVSEPMKTSSPTWVGCFFWPS